MKGSMTRGMKDYIEIKLVKSLNLADIQAKLKPRYKSHQEYKALLHDNHSRLIHISKDEQKRRLLARFQDPKKLWKISEGDVRERSFWKEYQTAYGECIANTVSKGSPWYIVPGDDKESTRLSVSQILIDRFKKMQLEYPKLKHDEKAKLKKLKA